jgi:predicted HicB family RNase H-like nuclease
MTKTFPVQLPEDLHKELKHASIDEGLSLHDWIVKTLEERVKNGAPKKKPLRNDARASHNSR